MTRPAPYSPDFTPEEIERRYRLALWDLRHGGTGELARKSVQSALRDGPLRTKAVLEEMSKGDMTVRALARRLKRDLTQVWGHVCFLRKMQKVEVKRWVVSDHGRRMAVYGLK